jgi:hypothetical protein
VFCKLLGVLSSELIRHPTPERRTLRSYSAVKMRSNETEHLLVAENYNWDTYIRQNLSPQPAIYRFKLITLVVNISLFWNVTMCKLVDL